MNIVIENREGRRVEPDTYVPQEGELVIGEPGILIYVEGQSASTRIVAIPPAVVVYICPYLDSSGRVKNDVTYVAVTPDTGDIVIPSSARNNHWVQNGEITYVD